MLSILSQKHLPKGTDMHVLEDGTTFYLKFIPSEIKRLYIKQRDGKEIDLLSDEHYLRIDVYGNEIYVTKGFKKAQIHKVEQVGGVFSTRYVRDILKDENFKPGGLLSMDFQGYDQECFAYRICDDPKTDRVSLGVPARDLIDQLTFVAMHRRTPIFFEYSHSQVVKFFRWRYTAKTMYNFIVVKIDTAMVFEAYAQDTSPFVYFVGGGKLNVLDTRNLRFLPRLQFKCPHEIDRVVSVKDDIITLQTDTVAEICYSLTAKLPKGYYEPLTTVQQPLAAIQKLPQKENSLMSTYSEKAALVKKENAKKLLAMHNDVPQNQPQKQRKIIVFESEFLTKFTPLDLLGIGGFGCVFKAQHKVDKIKYAVKRIALRGSEESINDALAEVCTLAALRNEGIVGYNNSWIERPPPGWQNRTDKQLLKRMEISGSFNYRDDCVFLYVQMELCALTLGDYLDADNERSLDFAKTCFAQIVSGVEYLHRKGKIHRDLKPANILLTDEGTIKLCDLGLVADRAIKNGQEVDITRSNSGTVMYMAPEQAHGIRYSSKVDIFSLGLILTELIVRMSFSRKRKVFMNYQKGRPNTVLKHLPAVDRIVTWLTNIDPAKRPNCQQILERSFFAQQ